jgi:hypothetical protein
MRLNGFDREMLNQLGNSLNALKGPRDFIFFISVAIFSDGDISFSCLFSTRQGMRWFVCFKLG